MEVKGSMFDPFAVTGKLLDKSPLSSAPPVYIPSTIPGLLRAYEGDQILSLALVNDDPIDTWPDMSEFLAHATQDGARRPTFKLGVLNGLPVVHFPGWNGSIGPHMVMPTLSGVQTIIFIVRATGAGLTNNYLPLIGSTTGFPVFHGGGGTGLLGGPGQSDTALNDGTAWVNNVEVSPTAIQKPSTFKMIAFQPNLPIASGGFAPMNRITRDGYLGESQDDRVWEGDMAAIWAYSTIHTEEQRNALWAYGSGKYAL